MTRFASSWVRARLRFQHVGSCHAFPCCCLLHLLSMHALCSMQTRHIIDWQAWSICGTWARFLDAKEGACRGGQAGAAAQAGPAGGADGGGEGCRGRQTCAAGCGQGDACPARAPRHADITAAQHPGTPAAYQHAERLHACSRCREPVCCPGHGHSLTAAAALHTHLLGLQWAVLLQVGMKKAAAGDEAAVKTCWATMQKYCGNIAQVWTCSLSVRYAVTCALLLRGFMNPADSLHCPICGWGNAPELLY